MKTRVNIDSQLASAIDAPLSIFTVLRDEIERRRDFHSAMSKRHSNFDSSKGAFFIDGEIDGLLRAMALVAAARSPADWHLKDVSLQDRCGQSAGESHHGGEIMEEVPALLAASLLDDAAAILRELAA
jgi:hypothetical protein